MAKNGRLLGKVALVTGASGGQYLPWGVRVNSVHPAQVSETGMATNATPAWRAANQQAIPMARAA